MIIIADATIASGAVSPNIFIEDMSSCLQDAVLACQWRADRHPMAEISHVSPWEMVTIQPGGVGLRAHVRLKVEVTAKQVYAFEMWCGSVADTLKSIHAETATEGYLSTLGSVHYQLSIAGGVITV